jgi:hypothetical protein
MPHLFRTPVLISRRQPYVDWANSLDDGPEFTIELAQKRDIYLGPHSDLAQKLKQVLDTMWEDIFKEELDAWSTEEQQWPTNRTREMFDAWFAAELGDSIIDLVPDEPLTEDDVELEELDAALNTCASCGVELVVGSGRMVSFQLSHRERLEHREGRVLTLLAGRNRVITGVVTPKDSTPAVENADIIFRACGRRCEKQILKIVPRALRDLEDTLANSAPHYSR